MRVTIERTVATIVAGIALLNPAPVRAQVSAGAELQAYVRNLAPSRAILRAKREERIVAVIRGAEATSGRITAVLYPPDGVQLVDGAERDLGRVEADSLVRVEWTVRAKTEVQGHILVALRDGESHLFEQKHIDVNFQGPAPETSADYVPTPGPAKCDTLLLAHHCPLWKYGAHFHGWDTIAAWPERKPAIGFYDEGTPVATDWHIKYALEHGIGGFIYIWDKTLMNPLAKNSLASAIHDGFLKARFRDRFLFCLNWTTNSPEHNGVRDSEEVLEEILPFWIDNYFGHDSYVKLDGRPLLFVNQPDALCEQLGGAEATRVVFDEVRKRVVAAGFQGLVLVGNIPCAKPQVQDRLAVAGYDASSSYDIWIDGWATARQDRHGIPAFSHREMMAKQRGVLEEKRKSGVLPDIASVHMGWDSRPWHGQDTVYYMAEPSAAAFELACRNAKDVFTKTPGAGIDTRFLVLNNWNEFGEGHYIAPTAGFGFEFLDVVRRVFTAETEPCQHVIPEDLGLQPPDAIYRACSETLRKPFGDERKARGDIVAWWNFDLDTQHVALDASGGGFDGFRDLGGVEAGVSGNALACRDGGTVTLATHPAFFPASGLAVELWCKPATEQRSAFLVNTSSEPKTGYGLALEQGKPTFYVNWSQRVQAQKPLPLNTWTHLVAVSDNRELILYVNGVESARQSSRPVVAPTSGAICLGSYSGTGNAVFHGALDEVRIHGRPLAAEDVSKAFRR